MDAYEILKGVDLAVTVTRAQGSWRWQDAYGTSYYSPVERENGVLRWSLNGSYGKFAITQGSPDPNSFYGGRQGRRVTERELLGVGITRAEISHLRRKGFKVSTRPRMGTTLAEEAAEEC